MNGTPVTVVPTDRGVSSRPTPVLRKETVPTPNMGEFVVRGLKLSERISLRRQLVEDAKATDAGDMFTARLLAMAVTDLAGRPVYTAEEWDIVGGQSSADVDALMDVAARLGGFDKAAEKKG